MGIISKKKLYKIVIKYLKGLKIKDKYFIRENKIALRDYSIEKHNYKLKLTRDECFNPLKRTIRAKTYLVNRNPHQYQE